MNLGAKLIHLHFDLITLKLWLSVSFLALMDESELDWAKAFWFAKLLRPLSVYWTETGRQKKKSEWKYQDTAQSFVLLWHDCRIWNNNSCEKYSSYSKTGRKSHLCPETRSNPLRWNIFSFLTCNKQRVCECMCVYTCICYLFGTVSGIYFIYYLFIVV